MLQLMHINKIKLETKNCAQDFHNNSLENTFFGLLRSLIM